jgi:TonB family protein
MCANGSGPTLDLNLDTSPFTDPIRVEVAVPIEARGPFFDFLDQKVCVSGQTVRKGSRRVLALTGISDIEPRRKPDGPPQLPSGVVRACAPGAVTPPVVSSVPPRFPPDALSRGAQGMVVVEVIVAPDGSVQRVRVVRRVDPGIDEAVVAAAKQWRFGPGEHAVALFLEFTFTLVLQ